MLPDHISPEEWEAIEARRRQAEQERLLKRAWLILLVIYILALLAPLG